MILLHCCCAPCSISVVTSLKEENLKFDLFWYNPNIQPEDEYNKRLECLTNFADNEHINLIRFNSVTFGADSCEFCYRTRLEETAKTAKQNNYDAFTTTLLISPYQDHEAIKRIGEEVADQYGVEFFYKDFRPLFREGQKEARARGFYMQKYCGCGKDRDQVAGVRDQGIVVNKLINKQHEMITNINPTPYSLSPPPYFDRLELLTGTEGLERLKKVKVIIFGVGGVGSWCAEALVRSGIGKLDIVDFDTVAPSNINRQLQATSKTIGKSKVEVLKQRLTEINPDCEVTAHNTLFSKETADSFNIASFDYVIDAIDMLANKLDLIETVCNANVKLFSSMGMALKMDPLRIKTASIWKTDVCPLARLVRQGLRKRGFKGDFMTVYSTEEINKILTQSTPSNAEEDKELKTLRRTAGTHSALSALKTKKINGSLVTVTATAGLLLANLVIQDVIQ